MTRTNSRADGRGEKKKHYSACYNLHHPHHCYFVISCCLLALGFEYQLAQRRARYRCRRLCWREIKCASVELSELRGSGNNCHQRELAQMKKKSCQQNDYLFLSFFFFNVCDSAPLWQLFILVILLEEYSSIIKADFNCQKRELI